MLYDYVSSELDAKNAVLLAKRYRVDSWLKAAYIRMLRGPLKIEEMLQTPSLDWETIARIKQLELTFNHAYCPRYAQVDEICGGREFTPQINSVIEQSFRMELDNMKWTPSANPVDPPFPGKYIVFHHKMILLLTRRHGNSESDFSQSTTMSKKKKKKGGLLGAT